MFLEGLSGGRGAVGFAERPWSEVTSRQITKATKDILEWDSLDWRCIRYCRPKLTALFGLKSNKSLRFIRIRLLNVKSPAGGLPTSAWANKIRHCNLLSDQRTIIRINILALIILIIIVNIIIIIVIAKKRKGGAEQEAAAAVLSIPHCTALHWYEGTIPQYNGNFFSYFNYLSHRNAGRRRHLDKTPRLYISIIVIWISSAQPIIFK